MLSYVGQWIGENLLFSTLLESDNRLPCATFAVPPPVLAILHILKEEGGDREGTEIIKFGLLLPRIEFWIALVSVS